MKCVCGGDTRVLDTRHDVRGTVSYRQRYCTKCGKMFYTRESYQPVTDTFKFAWDSTSRWAKRNRYKNGGGEDAEA